MVLLYIYCYICNYLTSSSMDETVLKKLAEQEQKIDAIYASVEKTRKYFLWTLITSLAFFVLPLIGLTFAIPFFLNTLAAYSGL